MLDNVYQKLTEPRRENTGFRIVSVKDKKLEISDLGRRGIYYPSSENKGADQLRG